MKRGFGPSARTGPVAEGLDGWRLRAGIALVIAVALVALLPTLGDIGLTWDEPSYRYSQVVSAQWWERLAEARSWGDVEPLLTPDALLYYWPYGRFGINFHPPLAGQLNLLTYEVFGRWWKDIPARRLASAVEFALTLGLLFGVLARRYGGWVGGVAAGALLLMPRVFAHAHIAGTDLPGLLLWAATAVAFWKGLNEPRAGRWRVAVGVLLGLAFVEKMAAVLVLAPLLLWLIVARLPATLSRRTGVADWLDGATTLGALALPLVVALAEIERLSRQYERILAQIAQQIGRPATLASLDLFQHRPPSPIPGAILLAPLVVWLVRRLLARLRPGHWLWGVERPALEMVAAVLAFASAVGWLGNPAWWREALPRLAHYAMLNAGRQGALPDIRILYFGEVYLYSLPWHNAFVLAAITVPVGILAAAAVGMLAGFRRLRTDRLPLYFALHMLTLPVVRMLPTPAHDGVRLFLPTFFFLAAFAGWGAVAAADGLARVLRLRRGWLRALVAALVLGPSGWGLVGIHPFELSYYNALIGGPAGAWRSGFELSYWYDAFNPATLAELNRRLPEGAVLAAPDPNSAPPTFDDLQHLGALRSDIVLAVPELERFPHEWLLTHDSKASGFTRLLFAMEPWYARRPPQLGGLRVATVADPVAVSRALALQLLADRTGLRDPQPAEVSPWVRRLPAPLARFWGVGLQKAPPPLANDDILDWARRDPSGLRAAADTIAGWARTDPGRLRIELRRAIQGQPSDLPAELRRLLIQLTYHDRRARLSGHETGFAATLLRFRAEALAEAAAILAARPDSVREVLTRFSYTDPDRIGGPLDRGFGRAGDR